MSLRNEANKLMDEIDDLMEQIEEKKAKATAVSLGLVAIEQCDVKLHVLDMVSAWPGLVPHYAVTLKEIAADYQKAQSVSPWISVNDQLPELDVNVLVLLSSGVCVGSYGDQGDGLYWSVADDVFGDLASAETHFDDDYNPSHWMPIPAVIA